MGQRSPPVGDDDRSGSRPRPDYNGRRQSGLLRSRNCARLGPEGVAEVPVRFNLDRPRQIKPAELAHPSVRTWLVTSARVVGRLTDDRLHGYRSERAVGARVDLTPDPEP